MSGKTVKILRKGAKKYNLPYKLLKRAFKNLDLEEREDFLLKTRRPDWIQ